MNPCPSFYLCDRHQEYDYQSVMPKHMWLRTIVDLQDLDGVIDAETNESIVAKINEVAPYLNAPDYCVILSITGSVSDHSVFLQNLIKYAIEKLPEVWGDGDYFDYYPGLIDMIVSYAYALDQEGEVTPLIRALFAQGSPYDDDGAVEDLFSEYRVFL